MNRFTAFQRVLCLLLVCVMLTGCASDIIALPNSVPKHTASAQTTEPEQTTEATEPPTEPPTAPPDGNPNDVTCQGSYTGQVSAATAVATAGEATLTAGTLQLLYGLEVATWRRSGTEPAPDWDQGLDTQLSPFEGTAVTWQQFFLQRALNNWHSYQALLLHSASASMPLDPEYLPYAGNYERYMMETMPAMRVLYGYDPSYKVNTLHQEFIDNLPQLLSELGGAEALAQQLGGSSGAELQTLAELINYAYAYFTFASDYLGVTEEAIAAEEANTGAQGYTVSFRQVFFTGEDAESAARNIVDVEFPATRKKNEGSFASLANLYSQDAGTQLSGGLYSHISQGQLPQELDSWLFDPARVSGDMTVVQSELGWHALYFSGKQTNASAQAQETLTTQAAQALLDDARGAIPMDVDYKAIKLSEISADAVGIQSLLYPDIAHERIPEVPVHIQQDYTTTMYGAFPLVSYGCGITTLAMLATYMTDTWLTPAALAKVYGDYCYITGTDARLIDESAPELGYFVLYKTYDWKEVRDLMSQGYVAVVLQHKGYFTRGGHYLVLRQLNEDGTVSIRDSNLYNYGKLLPHRDDRFEWSQIVPSGVQYWVFQNKITRIAACSRCGDGSAPEGLLQDYTCQICHEALSRYNNFLALTPEN